MVRALAGDSTMTRSGPVGFFFGFGVLRSSGAGASATAASAASAVSAFFDDFLGMWGGIVAVLGAVGSRNGNTAVLGRQDAPKARKASIRGAPTRRGRI